MKTVFLRRFMTRNFISSDNQRNYEVELKLDLQQDVIFNKEDKIKHHAIDEEYVVINEIRYNLDENIREVLLSAKGVKARTQEEFLSEVQPYEEKGWYK
ncbi:hypothetical protein [Lysinibacillus sp. GbtcB16]|uniref:hypothetical protein n=1 Tax=Lysinibacillus sp. GbtcB16 TaxID=2824761 RepID=UPI001C2F785D|nr:hypothetical protein [Lysinibacillus sp. GbtcB16]